MFNHSLTAKRIFLNAGLAFVAALVFSAQAHAMGQQNRQLVKEDSKTSTNRRVALVIGNAAYETSPLKNPVNDSRDVAQALRELGFDVIYRENVSQNDMKRAIREFGEKIRGGGVALFYYAGHGVQVRGINYLVPVDAKVESEEEVEYECVNAGLVLAQMDSAGNGMNIMILDACRNNPFARSFRSSSSGLAQMDAPSGTLIAYATAPGSVASDGTARNGLYTQELLRFVRTPNLSLEEVFKQVRIAVRGLTQGKQTPWESSSLTGDFYFLSNEASKNKPVSTSPLQPFDPAAIELSYWETIKSSTNPEDFKAYLREYPNGRFASLARNRLNPEVTAKPVEETVGSSPSAIPNETSLSFADYESERKRAEQLYGQNRFTEALPVFEKLAAANPTAGEIIFRLAFCLNASITTMSNSEARIQARVRVHNLSVRAKALGVKEQLLESMLESVPANGVVNESFSSRSTADAAMREGEAAFAQGNLDTALAAYSRALQADSNLYEAPLYAGDVCFKKALQSSDTRIKVELLDEAGVWFGRAIAIDSNRETAYRYWGDALLARDRFDEAREKFIEGIIADPYTKLSFAGLQNWAVRMNKRLSRLAIPRDAATRAGNSGSLNEGVRELRAAAEAIGNKESSRESKNLVKLNEEGLLDACLLLDGSNASIAKSYQGYRTSSRDKLRRYLIEFVINGGSR